MNTVQQLVQEVKEKSVSNLEKRKEYLTKLHELLQGCKTKRGVLGISYFPSSYNGEKICFGILPGEEKELMQMMNSLMAKGLVESFFTRLVEVELPFHMNDDFHAHKEWIIGYQY